MNQFSPEAERHLASADSIPAVLQRVARAVVPALGDFCLIFLAKDEVKNGVTNANLPCAASAHVTGDGERMLRRLNRVYKIRRNDPVSTVANVVRSGRAQLRSEIASEAQPPFVDPRVFMLHQHLGVCSALVVPIGARPHVLGAISLSYAHSGRHYSAHDLPAARRLATSIAMFLHRRARMRRSHLYVPLAGRRILRLRARV